MAVSSQGRSSGSLQQQLAALAAELDRHDHGDIAVKLLENLVSISRSEADRLDWEILHGALSDISKAFEVFHPGRAQRKVSVFGSSRTDPDHPVYAQCEALALALVQGGFDVLTGAGNGVMEAANKGAGPGRSYGLDIHLPFEQAVNRYIESAPRLITFRHFFTRKLFFLRESDGLVVMPGGFGTLDELFEALTLIQTAKTPPIPVVLLAPRGDDYWLSWQHYVNSALCRRGMISHEDHTIYRLLDSVEGAVTHIARFHRVFHACRFDGNRLQMLLNLAPSDTQLAWVNHNFADLLLRGSIEAGRTSTAQGTLATLEFWFDMRHMGRLYALIDHLNSWPADRQLAAA
ncbi:MAG: LOG family protein [Aphanocapsa feldmannii 277cV]|uniref:LOG family protein n=2 Tax=Aphanocapsa feldmannii TaxID=192050 RepID=A0A524RKQ9_9CHRO|nr:MAG: LOG family protein [Aphanocapsa feldmannii 288cV]TGG90458.1 MAG: LOG family protein [Aphanocapsa feldmannii 277cV]